MKVNVDKTMGHTRAYKGECVTGDKVPVFDAKTSHRAFLEHCRLIYKTHGL